MREEERRKMLNGERSEGRFGEREGEIQKGEKTLNGERRQMLN